MTRYKAQNACDGGLHIKCTQKKNPKPKPKLGAFGPSNYAKYDPTMFSDDLKSVDWNIDRDPSGINERQDCVDELWSDFKAKFVAAANRHALLIQKKVRGIDNCPWMTGKIKKDIRQSDYLLKKARKTNRDEDWLAYKSMRNRVSRSVKKAKQTYNKKLIENH